MEVQLVNNNGYKWYRRGKSAFKGYIIKGETREVLRGESALHYLSEAASFTDLKRKVRELDGSFSFVISRSDKTWIGVDVARSMPIFYSKEMDVVSDSVKEIAKVRNLQFEDLELSAVEEFIRSYYIGHGRTIYKDIFQLDAGQIAELCDSDGVDVKKEYYFLHRSQIVSIEREDALKLLTKTAEEVFRDVIKVAGGRPIVVSLSGGYDSRFVACMLKRVGAQDVSCYSYGKGLSFEVKKAKQIAEQLGYRWTFVDYTDERMKKYFPGSYIDFFDVYGGMDSVPYIQNYVAVTYLKEKGWFKDNSVFVTGLCNDMQTGAYTKGEEELKNYKPSLNYLCQHIIERRNLNKSLGDKALREYRNVLNDTIDMMGIEINNYQEFVSATESIEAILLHSRVFLHMNDVHGQNGFEWILPCWNKKNLTFWYSLPFQYRIRQNLYEEWQMTSIPFELGVAEKKVRVSYTLYTGGQRLKARIRLLLKRIVLYPNGIKVNEETDYNNFNVVAARYFKRIKEKSAIWFRNLSTNNILALYVAEQWLGKDIYKRVVKQYEKE